MVLQRNEINEKDTWDLSTIYPTDQAWEEALKDLTEQLETVAQYEGHLLDSADSLLEITEFSLEMKPYLHLELISYPAFPIASA